MSATNAKLVNDTIMLFALVCFLLVIQGKIPLRKKMDFLEKNRSLLTILVCAGLLYPVYSILTIVFK